MKTHFTFNMKASRKSAQHGASIVSVMLGILVGGLMLVVAVNQFQDANKKTRIETATQEGRCCTNAGRS